MQSNQDTQRMEVEECSSQNIEIKPQWIVIPEPLRNELSKPLDKSVQLKIYFLISQPKHMLWVLKKNDSMRHFF